jgi:hypothetical protein
LQTPVVPQLCAPVSTQAAPQQMPPTQASLWHSAFCVHVTPLARAAQTPPTQ